ncbi:DUF448 domain-containing protein [Campylobacter canadensis]|uniref:DUF448 domain-containing protein n=1 Tax=Campylobacter canadensis TaxID=449520 RepID=A0ABS7WQZ3_9BACT|nr:DUF448 domain-containing protein [Campylobacter canadensis]MBZ7987190.1 DUF448 domain-containing protein [Campylobacter canadensis]MBZ7994458.1 DUF448 domain-containing protein [Campylobacter canadensis]MBZ7996455.1 DUF448 domain-containing protein [Campylobacter canadensis]MBZ7998186.1 DUF448 domain-containing protein [Campylobacter canadensis]MBZ7999827.1 DUF448 domain-containing protein [Campylobacter canadensis]
MNKAKPIRMCIVCKNRFFKEELHRFALKDNELSYIFDKGRTNYICNECLKKDSKDLHKSFCKFYKNNLDKISIINQLKERFLNGSR